MSHSTSPFQMTMVLLMDPHLMARSSGLYLVTTSRMATPNAAQEKASQSQRPVVCAESLHPCLVNTITAQLGRQNLLLGYDVPSCTKPSREF